MDQRIVDFYNRYNARKLAYPGLYFSGIDSINVILPTSLVEYANAAAGHTGFGAGARARGIRRSVSNSTQALASIFSSPSNVEAFLNSSEKNAGEYIASVRARHLIKQKMTTTVTSTTDDRPANETFFEKYNVAQAKALQAKFGRDMVLREFGILTINEFELRYGL